MAKKIVDEIKDVLKGRKKKKDEYPYSASEKVVEKAVEEGVLVKRKDTDTMITQLMSRVVFLEHRIDRIITAHESCKTLKGL